MKKNPFSLENKTILVTGASSGIGQACAIQCAGVGAKVIATGRDEKRLEETLSQMGSEQPHTFVSADLTNPEDVEKLLATIDTPIDGIVHSAGICETRPFAFINRKKLENIFNVNIFTPALITKELLKRRKINAEGSIVFISSIDGPITSHVGNSMYASSKGAVSALVKGMAVELAERKIRVNAILPGMTETPLIYSPAFSAEQLEKDKSLYPLKRYGKPEEIAYAAIYLLSDAAAWTTGTQLVVDGGFTLV